MSSDFPPTPNRPTAKDDEYDATSSADGRRRRPSLAELIFTYTLEESVSPDRRHRYCNIERWMVTVAVGDGEPDQSLVTIGDARVIVIELDPGRDVRDFADVVLGEWREAEADAVDGPTRYDRPPAEPDRPSARTHVLVLDRIWVKPDYRGKGLGPTIAAAVINRLGRGCHMAACYPAPFEGDRRDREGEIEALGRLWAKVGFRHWRDGVWMLPLGECPILEERPESVAAVPRARASGPSRREDAIGDRVSASVV